MSEAQLRRISYLRSIVKDKDAEIEHQADRIEQLEAALREVCGLEVYGFAITGPDGKDVVCEGTNRFVRETDFKAVRKTARAALEERT